MASPHASDVGQITLGFFYEHGRGGLPKNDREAARLYKLAADQGNADAETDLGVLYNQGGGGPAPVETVSAGNGAKSQNAILSRRRPSVPPFPHGGHELVIRLKLWQIEPVRSFDRSRAFGSD